MVTDLSKLRMGTLFPAPFGTAGREMDHFFDEFFTGDRSARPRDWAAPVSLWEDEQHFYVEVDLPGVAKDDVDVTVDKGTLRVAAERKPPEHQRDCRHQERGYGHVERLFSLPETTDLEAIDASLRDGVLLVTLNKRPDAQPKRVTVKGEQARDGTGQGTSPNRRSVGR